MNKLKLKTKVMGHFLNLLILLCIVINIINGKNLKQDLIQIRTQIHEWEEELEGHDEIDAASIPDLNNQSLHILEKVPKSEGQSYIVYKQMSVDTTKYTRHAAYIRRFKAVSAVEWNPIENAEDNRADGDFVEIFVPSLFTHKRCNAIISTPAQSVYNFFYKQEHDNCTVPTPYQDCCGRPDSFREDIDMGEVGRSVSELDEDEVDEDGDADGWESENEVYSANEKLNYIRVPDGSDHRRKKRMAATTMKPTQNTKVTTKKPRKIIKVTKVRNFTDPKAVEDLENSLKFMEGPPGYFALGEFYQDVLDVVNGSTIVYQARERVDILTKETVAQGQTAVILNVETMIMTSPAYAVGNYTSGAGQIPNVEDPFSAFTGYLSCNYTLFKTAKPALDRVKRNVVKFYLHKLRAQCVVHAFDKTLALFDKELISVTTGLRTKLNGEHDFIRQGLLTKQEWIDLISAVFFVTFSNAYMDVSERMSRGVHDNRNAVGQEISWTVRTLTVMALRCIVLVDEILSTHVVKTLQIVTSAVKEKFFQSLNEYLKLEDYCTRSKLKCTKQLQIIKTDQLHLISLMQFVVYGSSVALQEARRSVQDEFNQFYVKTLNHTQGILKKVYEIGKAKEVEAEKHAVEDDKKGVDLMARQQQEVEVEE